MKSSYTEPQLNGSVLQWNLFTTVGSSLEPGKSFPSLNISVQSKHGVKQFGYCQISLNIFTKKTICGFVRCITPAPKR